MWEVRFRFQRLVPMSLPPTHPKKSAQPYYTGSSPLQLQHSRAHFNYNQGLAMSNVTALCVCWRQKTCCAQCSALISVHGLDKVATTVHNMCSTNRQKRQTVRVSGVEYGPSVEKASTTMLLLRSWLNAGPVGAKLLAAQNQPTNQQIKQATKCVRTPERHVHCDGHVTSAVTAQLTHVAR